MHGHWRLQFPTSGTSHGHRKHPRQNGARSCGRPGSGGIDTTPTNQPKLHSFSVTFTRSPFTFFQGSSIFFSSGPIHLFKALPIFTITARFEPPPNSTKQGEHPLGLCSTHEAKYSTNSLQVIDHIHSCSWRLRKPALPLSYAFLRLFMTPQCGWVGSKIRVQSTQIETHEGARPLFKTKTRNSHHKMPQNRAKPDFK